MISKSGEPRWVRTGIKPFSINNAYQGRKVKTQDYRRYERYLMKNLPSDYHIPESGPLKLLAIVSYSSRNSDIDNCLKPFIDVLQKKYGFNDNRIYEIQIVKKIVPTGCDEIAFTILPRDSSKND